MIDLFAPALIFHWNRLYILNAHIIFLLFGAGFNICVTFFKPIQQGNIGTWLCLSLTHVYLEKNHLLPNQSRNTDYPTKRLIPFRFFKLY
jgi:hypothetical protein